MENPMQTFVISSIALIVVLSVRPASAQTFTFDENGRGQNITTGTAIPFSVLPAPLTYDLGYTSTAGDIVVTEPGTPNNAPSDILRFDANGNVTVFSDLESTDPSPDLADVTALPTPSTNAVFLLENGPGGAPGVEGGVNGLFGYTPPAGTPGSGPASLGPVTFNFISDVPEPSSWGLAVLGLGLALLIRRRRPIAGQPRGD
jgi:MYXO-CTERM domain-containing protein